MNQPKTIVWKDRKTGWWIVMRWTGSSFERGVFSKWSHAITWAGLLR